MGFKISHSISSQVINEWREEVLFLFYLLYILTLDVVDCILGFVCLRWSTGDGLDQNIETTPHTGNKWFIVFGGWYDVVSFESVTDSVHVIHSNFFISS